MLPLNMSPVAAVYVKTMVLPVCDAETFVVVVVAVPAPSGAYSVIVGDAAMAVTTPPAVEASFTCHVCAPGPAAAVAVAPEP